MFKKTIKFVDFNEVEQKVDFYFHLSKADLMKMGVNDKMQKHLLAIVASKDGVELIKEMESLIATSVGIRSEDGSRFEKSPEITAMLMQSPAYGELLVELCTNLESAESFVSQLIPKKMVEQLEKKFLENAKAAEIASVDADPFKEPPNPMVSPSSNAVDVQSAPRWVKEQREPTQDELMKMGPDELKLAFRLKGSFSK